MRTNIVINDNLVSNGLRIAKVNTKRELIHIALEEYIENHSRKNLRNLKGKIKFDNNYDYKVLRRN